MDKWGGVGENHFSYIAVFVSQFLLKEESEQGMQGSNHRNVCNSDDAFLGEVWVYFQVVVKECQEELQLGEGAFSSKKKFSTDENLTIVEAALIFLLWGGETMWNKFWYTVALCVPLLAVFNPPVDSAGQNADMGRQLQRDEVEPLVDKSLIEASLGSEQLGVYLIFDSENQYYRQWEAEPCNKYFTPSIFFLEREKMNTESQKQNPNKFSKKI